MTSVLHEVEAFFLAGVGFLAVGVLGSSLLVRALAPRLLGWEPRTRHRALLWLVALPAVVTAVLLVALALPAVAGVVSPSLDHCRAGGSDHPHLCFAHPGAATTAACVLTFPLAAALLWAGAHATLAALRVRRAEQLASALASTGEPRAELDATVVEAPGALALTAGILRPRVLLSRELLTRLSPGELRVVLAHEHAHVSRRDTLVTGVARALAALHTPGIARWLLGELALAAEQSCDEEASRAVGDRTEVASALLSVVRAGHHGGCAHGDALGPRHSDAPNTPAAPLARRVHALLAPPAQHGGLRALALGFGMLGAAVLAASGELNHATAALLAALPH